MMRLFNDALAIEKGNPAYRLVMSYENDDQVTQYAEFDYIGNDVTATDEVNVSMHPVASGYEIADHIFRKPKKIRFSAIFAEHGKKAYNWTDENRLGNIQNEFERLMKAGVRFRLVTQSSSESNQNRFREYKDMIIQSISWRQHQDSMDADFDMVEVLNVNTADYIEVEKDLSDPNLPAITELSSMSFTDIFFDTDKTTAMVIKTLLDLDLIDPETIAIIATSTVVAITAVLSAVIAVKAAAAIASAIGAAAASGPYGWIALAVVAVVAAIVVIIVAICKEAKRQKYVKAGLWFKLNKNASKAEKEDVIRRLGLLIYDIQQSFESIAQGVRLLSFTSNDRQECGLYFNNAYYTMRIDNQNIYNGQWNATLLKFGRDKLFTKKMSGVSSIDNCTDQTCFYNPGDGSPARMYLVHSTAAAKKLDPTNQNALPYYDLRNFVVVTSTAKMEDVLAEIKSKFEERFAARNQ